MIDGSGRMSMEFNESLQGRFELKHLQLVMGQVRMDYMSIESAMETP